MLGRILTSVAALVVWAAWCVVFMYSLFIAPDEGPEAEPSSVTWLGVVVILGLAVSGVAAGFAAAGAVLYKQKTRASWLFIVLAVALGGAWLIAVTSEAFDCNPTPDVGNCAGQ